MTGLTVAEFGGAVLEELKYEIEDEQARETARIKIVGVGGCGCNAVAHMMSAGLEGADFFALNTDFQALESSPVRNRLALGGKLTHGRGAGADPEIGKQAALEDTERIVELLQGGDLVFITAGLGMGTGTGAAPVVANIARNLGALTIAIVMKPFSFQGARATRQAENGLTELAATVDTMIAIPNDRLLALAPRGTSFVEAFRMGHESVRQTVQDIIEIMTAPGFINRDFADVRSTMAGSGYAVLGTAAASGQNAAVEAARRATGSPLLEGAGIRGAGNILINITGSSRLGLHEVNDACTLIRETTGNTDVQINFGLVLDESMGDSVKVTVIATGFTPQAHSEPEPEPAPARAPEPEPEPVRVRRPSQWLSEQVAAAAAPEPEPAPPELPVYAAPPPPPPLPEPEIYEDELDRPAYERRRRLH